MRRTARLCVLVFASLILAGIAAAQSKGMSAADKEVWQLEEKYWQYAQAFDLQNYRSLWAENYVGWPWSESVPVGKDTVTRWLERRKAAGDSLRYRLQREAVHQMEAAVVTYYFVMAEWVSKDGKTERETSRLTHTWMKVGGQWKIVSGMSAPVEKSASK